MATFENGTSTNRPFLITRGIQEDSILPRGLMIRLNIESNWTDIDP